MPKKQRNRDKNKTKKSQPESDKTLVKLTLRHFSRNYRSNRIRRMLQNLLH